MYSIYVGGCNEGWAALPYFLKRKVGNISFERVLEASIRNRLFGRDWRLPCLLCSPLEELPFYAHVSFTNPAEQPAMKAAIAEAVTTVETILRLDLVPNHHQKTVTEKARRKIRAIVSLPAA